jgi:hypothetical protein
MSTKKPVDAEPEIRRDKDGRRLCNAKQNTCRGKAVKTGSKCWSHGGASPKGTASASYKHGGYSKYIKIDRLGDIYESISEDEDLYSANEDLRFLKARIYQLIEGLPSRELTKELKAAWVTFRQATRAQDEQAARVAFVHLDELITAAECTNREWSEIYSVMRQLERTRETSHKRLVDAELLIRTDQALSVAAQLVYVFKDALFKPGSTPDDVLAAVIAQWTSITGKRHPQFIEGAVEPGAEDKWLERPDKDIRV